MPLAIADADSISSSRGLAICFYFIVTPDRSLILGASTGSQIWHALARVERPHAELPAERLELLPAEPHERPRNSAIALDQEHRRNVRKAVSIAGRISRTGAIEQYGGWYQLPGMEGRLQGKEAVLAALRADPGLLEEVRRVMLEHIADQVADEVPEEDTTEEAGEVLDFATGALTEDFEPDQAILDRLRAEHPSA